MPTSMAVLFIILAIWLAPFIIVLTSEKTSGGEKAAWLLMLIFVSWFTWIFYMLLAPLQQRETPGNR